MNKIITNAAKKNDSRRLVDIPDVHEPYYFFFMDELGVLMQSNKYPKSADSFRQYQELKKTTLRHMIPCKGEFYDYIVDKNYATLDEWARDNKQSTSNILYGRNRVFSNNHDSYIMLDDLLFTLNKNWVWPEEDAAIQEYAARHSQIVANVNATLAKMKLEIDDIRHTLSQMVL